MISSTNSNELQCIEQAIFDKNGFNILVFDVRKMEAMTDFFVFAEGTVDRHVKALADAVILILHEKGRKPLQVEGMREGDWVVLDYGDIVVHLFTPDFRIKYDVEGMWRDGEIVDVKIETKIGKMK